MPVSLKGVFGWVNATNGVSEGDADRRIAAVTVTGGIACQGCHLVLRRGRAEKMFLGWAALAVIVTHLMPTWILP